MSTKNQVSCVSGAVSPFVSCVFDTVMTRPSLSCAALDVATDFVPMCVWCDRTPLSSATFSNGIAVTVRSVSDAEPTVASGLPSRTKSVITSCPEPSSSGRR